MENFKEFLYSKFLQSTGVSIDTRTLSQGAFFFGINGPNFKGAKYAAHALSKGASYAIIDDPEFVNDERIIFCENTLLALQELARFHRNLFQKPVIALTGSNGKTTTKELINRVLQKKYITKATRGNLNNYLGVPLTLLDIGPQVEVAIIEMGANHIGEIAELCAIAKPTHGLITNIGHAHTATFGGIEGVIRGKSELFEHLRATAGTPFINIDDLVLSNMAKRFDKKITYPSDELAFLSAEPMVHYSFNGTLHKTNLMGAYNYSNIAAAYSIGRHFEVDQEAILSAIDSYIPDNMRSQYVKKGTNQLILDAYNANPDSMRVALKNLAGFKGKKVAILGDMNELENPEEAHINLLKEANEISLEMLLLVGVQMHKAKEIALDAIWFASVADAAAFLNNRSIENSTVLIKASRSMKLEELIDSF